MAKQNAKATPLTEEQLSKKETDLQAVADKLAKDRADFEAEKKAFDSEKTDFEKQKKTFESEKVATAPEAAIGKFEFEDESYEFAPNAPKVINFGGQKFTQKEIIENESVLLQLIGGNSNLIKKVK